MKTIVLAFGTRPEATKMAPVYTALQAQHGLRPLILSTGQQREQLDGALSAFGLTPDEDLRVMTQRQTLAELTGRIVPQAGKKLREMGADMVLVHGDTSTSFCVALSAFYEGIAVGHVEAGLRSGSLAEPFPEEANRRLTGVLSTLDFAPTRGAADNLRREGKPEAGLPGDGSDGGGRRADGGRTRSAAPPLAGQAGRGAATRDHHHAPPREPGGDAGAGPGARRGGPCPSGAAFRVSGSPQPGGAGSGAARAWVICPTWNSLSRWIIRRWPR